MLLPKEDRGALRKLGLMAAKIVETVSQTLVSHFLQTPYGSICLVCRRFSQARSNFDPIHVQQK